MAIASYSLRKHRLLFVLATVLLVSSVCFSGVVYAQSWFDDFNRPDGPLGPNWTVNSGSIGIVSQMLQGSTDNSIATYNGANLAVVQADIVDNGTALQFLGLIFNHNAGDYLYVKVQNQDGDTSFEKGACYTANGTWFGLGFFDLTAPFATGHLKVERIGNDVYIDITNINGGADQHYVCSGAPVLAGTGVGVRTYGVARLDNWCAGPDCNYPPVAVDDGYTTAENTPLTVPAPGVLGNDTDFEGAPLTAALDTPPTNGDVVLATDGSFVYTPDLDFGGDDSFTYIASDGSLTDTATVLITVTAANDPPVAVDDNYVTDEDTPLTVPAPGVLDNDSDPNLDPLTAIIDITPTNGVLVLAADGSFVYTPNPEFSGNDGFTYAAYDGEFYDIAMVYITVTAVNDAPVAVDDNYVTDEDTPLTVAAPGLLGNDSDPEGDPLTAALGTPPANGNVVLAADGSFVYTPNPDFNGDDTFTYIASDGELTATATVLLTINPVNDAPVAVDDSYTAVQDTPLTVPAPGVLGNDTDLDGDPLTAALGTPPVNGVVALALDGSFVYTPTAGYSGPDGFEYIVSDGVLTDTGAVDIEVLGACTDVTGVELTLVTTGTIYAGDPVDLLADIIPDGFTAPYEYTIDYGDGTIITDNSGDDPLALNHIYATTGTFTVEIAVQNCLMTEPVTDSLELQVHEPGACVPLTGITIEGPTAGNPGVYDFSTVYEPDDATLPVAYVWDDGGTDANSTRTLGVGVYTLTVTAYNCFGVYVTDTHVITITEPVCVPVTGATLTQVTTGTVYAGDTVDLQADLAPDDVTTPYSYTLDYGDGIAAFTGSSSLDPLTFSHIYAAAGTFTVTIQVWNCGMSEPIVDTLQVTVSPHLYQIFLPIVYKNG